MTNEQAMELGRRAVACKGWRWMAGMKTTAGDRVLGYFEAPVCSRGNGLNDGGWMQDDTPQPYTEIIPDLEDHATLGCLLALVRSAHNDPTITTLYIAGRWEIRCDLVDAAISLAEIGPVGGEAELLISALEFAP